MKRTISLRVDVQDDDDYGEVIAGILLDYPQVQGWTATTMSAQTKNVVRSYGFEVEALRNEHGCDWLKRAVR